MNIPRSGIEFLNNKPYYKYSIQRGYTLTAIYHKFGFLKDIGYSNWKDVYNDSANDAFRKRFPDPDSIDFVNSTPLYVPAPPRNWQTLHKILMDTSYSPDYNSSDTAYWNDKKFKWEIRGGLNCTTSVNFFLAYMLYKEKDGYDPRIIDNLVNASAREGGVSNSGFSNHFKDLELAFNDRFSGQFNIGRLASSGSQYKGVDRFPWWEMPFGLNKEITCDCGLHVSPKYVMEKRHKLARVNVASVSLASGFKAGGLTRFKRDVWDGKENSFPFDTRKRHWEYTVMLLFKIKGDLYVYHQASAKSLRWRPFRDQAQAYVDAASKGKGQVQDSLWLVWRLPDSAWQSRNPLFFKDKHGSEWSPK